MSTLKFKSNIMCQACVAKVSPILNENEAVKNWEVDLAHEDKMLTVESDSLSASDIQKTIEKTGYVLEAIQ